MFSHLNLVTLIHNYYLTFFRFPITQKVAKLVSGTMQLLNWIKSKLLLNHSRRCILMVSWRTARGGAMTYWIRVRSPISPKNSCLSHRWHIWDIVLSLLSIRLTAPWTNMNNFKRKVSLVSWVLENISAPWIIQFVLWFCWYVQQQFVSLIFYLKSLPILTCFWRYGFHYIPHNRVLGIKAVIAPVPLNIFRN